MAAARVRDSRGALRELTIRAIGLGVLLALILGAANAYLGLYAGLTVSASIPAAVISMAILRALGGGTILENNVVQTVASAGEAVAAGAIFTFPALIILGTYTHLPYWRTTLLSAAGGTLGSLLVVFLRRAYIVEEKLPYPEGIACAQVLRAGAGESPRTAMLMWGALLAGIVKTAQDIAGLLPGAVSATGRVGRAVFEGSLNLSGALVGIGYIIGLRIASLVFAGGAFAWLIAVPVITAVRPGLRDLSAAEAAAKAWSETARYTGVGAMLVGGVLTLWRMRKAISRALSESIRMARSGESSPRPREDTDLAPRTILIGSACCIPLMVLLYYSATGSIGLSVALALALSIIAFFATSIAGYLTGIVGASNNPVSGVTVIVLLAAALLLKALGVAGSVGPQLAIMVGAVVCTSAAMAGDSLHDLATGFHLGATPRNLEIAVLIGAIASSLIIAPVLNMLIAGYGIAGTATARRGALAAPQAFLMAKVTGGVFAGGLPWTAIVAGAVIATGLGILDRRLEQVGSLWRTPVMPVAIGLYLPFGLSFAILAGAVVRSAFSEARSDQAGPQL
ncbi:MAG TPA: oligopeptide transporter, OPT family, partial [Candidatus Binataceae bacterium]